MYGSNKVRIRESAQVLKCVKNGLLDEGDAIMRIQEQSLMQLQKLEGYNEGLSEKVNYWNQGGLTNNDQKEDLGTPEDCKELREELYLKPLLDAQLILQQEIVHRLSRIHYHVIAGKHRRTKFSEDTNKADTSTPRMAWVIRSSCLQDEKKEASREPDADLQRSSERVRQERQENPGAGALPD